MQRVLASILALVCSVFFTGIAAWAQAGNLKIIHSFSGGSHGSAPSAGYGTVYSLDLDTGAFRVAYVFQGGSDGSMPFSKLLEFDGVLYGTTIAGGGSANCGNGGCGTIFSFDPKTHEEKIVWAFQGGSDGGSPRADLTRVNGVLYGTTAEGGGSQACLYGCGTAYSLVPATGILHILHAFQSGADGVAPQSGLHYIAGSGLLYGATLSGGSSHCFQKTGCGTLFSLDPATDDYRVLYAFNGRGLLQYPTAALSSVGYTLYGTAFDEPPNDGVFSFDLSTDKLRVLYAFKGGADGFNPDGKLSRIGDLLYGTTIRGGGTSNCQDGSCGTLFSINRKTGAETVEYAFQGGTDGANPFGNLLNIGGTIYGTTNSGGGNENCNLGCGTIFAFTP